MKTPRVAFQGFAMVFCIAGSDAVAAVVGDENWDPFFGVPGSDPGGIVAIVTVGNEVFLGGSFSTIGGIRASNVAKWDGRAWLALGAGINGVVDALVCAGEGLYAAGTIRAAGGLSVSNIARWDGTNWSSLGTGTDGTIIALAAQGGSLYAGGHFAMAGGVVASRIARWDGTNWSALGQGILPVDEVGYVESLEVLGQDLFVGGRFRNAGGVRATNIARWDGTNWFAVGGGLRNYDGSSPENGSVKAIVVDGTNLYAGGAFRLAGRTAATNIAKWTGAAWVSLGSGVNDTLGVLALQVNGGDLYAGGTFREIGGIHADRIAKWDGIKWSSLGTGISYEGTRGTVFGLAARGSEVFVTGMFDTAGGKPSTNLALWHIPHALRASRSDRGLTMAWPSTGTNFQLEATTNLGQTNWTPVAETPVLNDRELVVTNQTFEPRQFYRLRRR